MLQWFISCLNFQKQYDCTFQLHCLKFCLFKHTSYHHFHLLHFKQNEVTNNFVKTTQVNSKITVKISVQLQFCGLDENQHESSNELSIALVVGYFTVAFGIHSKMREILMLERSFNV